MEHRLPGQREAEPLTNFEQIAEAGYDGVCLDPNFLEIDDCLALLPLFQQFHLKCMVNAFPNSEQELIALLEMATALDAQQVNLISGVKPLTPAEACNFMTRWNDIAEPYPFPVLWETHRNATLNDLFFTLEVLGQIPNLPLCADLSHFVVDRELQIPLGDSDEAAFERILNNAESLQGRISNNEQIQIQIDFPQHAAWVEQFIAWWRQGLSLWLARQTVPQTFRFLVELGPPPYAITDGHQRELSDRWQEAKIIKQWVQDLWRELKVTV